MIVSSPVSTPEPTDSEGSPRRLRVLVSAYACNPYRGSEDGVGWGWIRAIATRHDVHVITADFQREHVERWQGEYPEDEARVTFHYVTRRWFHYRPTKAWTRIESSFLKPLMNLAYAQWLRDGARLAAALHEPRAFDLVHLVTYVGYRFPGRYDQLGIPFVWGPIGGLENTPWRFLPSLGFGGCIYYAARNVVNSIQKRCLPSPKRAFRTAEGGVIAATEGIRREIKRHYGAASEVIPEIGLPQAVGATWKERDAGAPLRITWSGEHLPGKALPFLLRALAQLDAASATDAARAVDWHLVVLGHGRSTRAWRGLAARLGLADRIRWTGWVERDAALEHMRSSHLFAITSLKDLTSTVLLEALSEGLPVVCPDHCGFSNIVDETCGIKVPLRSPKQFRRGLAAAIERIAGDEAHRRILSRGARRRAADYTWDEKASRVHGVYGRVMAVHAAQAGDAASARAAGVVRA